MAPPELDRLGMCLAAGPVGLDKRHELDGDLLRSHKVYTITERAMSSPFYMSVSQVAFCFGPYHGRCLEVSL